jgi:3-oxoacyl-[acyl-carrier-protein] synthase II
MESTGSAAFSVWRRSLTYEFNFMRTAPGGFIMRRVVITGIGVITPVGSTLDEFWGNIKAGRHGIAKVENMDMTGQKATLAAQVKGFNPEDYIDKKEARRMDPYTQFAVAAAKMAMRDCGDGLADLDPTTRSL